MVTCVYTYSYFPCVDVAGAAQEGGEGWRLPHQASGSHLLGGCPEQNVRTRSKNFF